MHECPVCGKGFNPGARRCQRCGCDLSGYVIAPEHDESLPDPPPAAAPEAEAGDAPVDAAGAQGESEDAPPEGVPSAPDATSPAPDPDTRDQDDLPELEEVEEGSPEPVDPSALKQPEERDEADDEKGEEESAPEVVAMVPEAPPAAEPTVPPPAQPTGAACTLCGADAKPCTLCDKGVPEPTLILAKEGPGRVRYFGREVSSVLMTTDQLSIGRRYPVDGHYPDLDLLSYFQAGSRGISRKHARIEYQPRAGTHVLTCLSPSKEMHHVTSGEGEPHPMLKDATVTLQDGDRIVIGGEVGFRIELPS